MYMYLQCTNTQGDTDLVSVEIHDPDARIILDIMDPNVFCRRMRRLANTAPSW